MSTPNDGRDRKTLAYWNEFKVNYVSLGFRKASFDLFQLWLQSSHPELAADSGNELQRRLHAYRKRLRERPKDDANPPTRPPPGDESEH